MSFDSIEVGLEKRSYEVHFDQDWNRLLQGYSGLQPVIITDRNVGSHYLEKWKRYLPEAQSVIVPPGEKSKSAGMLDNIYTFLIEQKYGRDTLIMALGGGVVGDLAGYAAATYMRGVSLIQVPTSLLAMVDSSVGGKVGVNHRLGKNLIGSFKQPLAVFVDFEHLNTLPRREWICGLGEMVKYALLDKQVDAQVCNDYFSGMENQLDFAAIATEIRKCIQIKSEIVAADETDINDNRIVLNLGHTIGHALETITEYKVFRHGEAVIAGLAGASYISHHKGLLNKKEFAYILKLLNEFPLPYIDNMLNVEQMVEVINHDKKVKGRFIRFVLLKGIGNPVVRKLTADEVEAGIEFTMKFLSANGG